MSEAATPQDGAMTFDQAVASLVTPEPVVEAPEAPVEAAEEQEPQGETSAPEEAAEGAENPEAGDEAETQEPAVEPLAAPAYWSKDAKERFGELSRELQEVVLAQEGPREATAAKAKAEAAEVRQRADAELGQVTQLAAALTEKLPQWQQAFTSKWGTEAPDWVALAKEHGAEVASLARMEFEADQKRLSEAEAKTAEAQAIAHQQFVRAETARLAELVPEIAPTEADPTNGQATREKIGKHLLERGIPKDALRQISAVEMSIAYDAMRYRELMAAAAAKPKPKPQAAPPKATVRPSVAQPSTATERSDTALAQRFGQSRSFEDAVALLASRQG